MHAGVGYSDLPDTGSAGKQAVEQAISSSGRTDPCDLVFLFSTVRHNQQILYDTVSAVVGGVPIYGGGSAGIITNDRYGYAGDQVGVACLWLDGVTCSVFSDNGLLDGEDGAGARLGGSLAGAGVTADSPVMLFYDAVRSSDENGVRLMMATWILEGLERSMGFLPNLAGAGLMGDHSCSATSQYIGREIDEKCAFALVFGGDIHMDSVVMHGCRPASAYYTVTKSQGPVILEINGRPAIAFINELVGPAIKPEQYPFRLIFGINSGDRFGEYNEENYASRLCLGIDKERNGVVMFEPDMVEGTEFQLMFPSYDLNYMRPKFESAFNALNGRKPVFAIYINCAGRCAGYGGADIEDALVLQQAVAGRVPVLGIYTGVEIGAVDGRPRGLDLTGVFCLFSQGEENGPEPIYKEPEPLLKPESLEEGAPDIQAGFLNRLCEQNAANMLALNTQITSLRYELELKRRGFRLLSELAVSLRRTEDYNNIFIQVVKRINAALNMQKTAVILSDGDSKFIPFVLQGFDPDEELRLKEKSIYLSNKLIDMCPVVIDSDNVPDCFKDLCEEFSLMSFVTSPIYLQGRVVAMLISGRIAEQEPFFTRLSDSDMETIYAITELLGSVLIRMSMKDIATQARKDGLTGLLNRNAFKLMVESYLSGGDEKSGAFIMIDVDYFKSVNDTYGHLAGDNLLKACADAMKGVLRDTDIAGRHGGDEFVVFCKGIGDTAIAEKKAAQLASAWKKLIPDGGTKSITSSIGISLFPNHGKTYNELYEKADTALYKAKERGRNGYVLFEEDM